MEIRNCFLKKRITFVKTNIQSEFIEDEKEDNLRERENKM